MNDWTIQEGIGVARIIETVAVANGGVSKKDCDIFLYLHTEKGKKSRMSMTNNSI